MHKFSETLKKVPLFSDLTTNEIDEIAPLFKLHKIRKNNVVLNINESGDYLYIVKYGQVKIVVPDESGEEDQVLAFLGQGNYFGEMSLLTGEPTSAAVKTSLDSEFLVLDKELFLGLLKRYSALSYKISMILSSRLRNRNILENSTPLPDKLAVLLDSDISDSVNFSFLLSFSLFLEGLDRVLIVSFNKPSDRLVEDYGFVEVKEKLDSFIAQHDVGYVLKGVEGTLFQYSGKITDQKSLKKLKKHRYGLRNDTYEYSSGIYFLQVIENGGDVGVDAISPLLGLVVQMYDIVIMDIGGNVDALSARALSQADEAIFVGEKNHESLKRIKQRLDDLSKIENRQFNGLSLALFKDLSIQNNQIRQIFKDVAVDVTNFSIKASELGTINHLIADRDSFLYRGVGKVARKITGNTVGIALGGGGARGYAHIGVLKVFEEEKFPIDIVAGSSMGALVGAVYCMTGSAMETEKILKSELAGHKGIFDFTIPFNSFLKGNRIKRISENIFKDMTFSDMFIPFHIVCVDLISGQEIFLNEGSVALAVQASSALPGIFRPVRLKNRYLVDGSVINKVPVNVLSMNKTDVIISVNVTPDREQFMESKNNSHGFVGKMLRKSQLFKQLLDEPNILQIISRSLNITNTQMSKTGSHFTNFDIKPSIEKFDFLNFKAFDPIVATGETATRDSIQELRSILGV